MTSLFKSTVLILPGLGNSGEQHWQTHWENQFGFERVQQLEWETPVCEHWIENVDRAVLRYGAENVILVGHSLACCAIVNWAKHYQRKIKGALLVAPSDTEASSYPLGTSGFTPMPMYRLPFPTVTVSSSDDFYVTLDRAKTFATAWGSDFINIGSAGHINVASGHGPWPQGLEYLRALDQ